MFQILAGEGRVYKCLFNHKFEEAMTERVSPASCPKSSFVFSPFRPTPVESAACPVCGADGICVQCREALTTRQKLIAQDYKVSYSLARSCKSDLRKYRCNADNNLPRAREARLSYLLLCLESAVHRGNGAPWRRH